LVQSHQARVITYSVEFDGIKTGVGAVAQDFVVDKGNKSRYIYSMLIEFDPAKDAINRAKHGLSLGEAGNMEWDTAVIWPDMRFDPVCATSPVLQCGEG